MQRHTPSLLVEREIFAKSPMCFTPSTCFPTSLVNTPSMLIVQLYGMSQIKSASDAGDAAEYRPDPFVPYDADGSEDYRSDHDDDVVAPTSHASLQRGPRSRSSSSLSTPSSSLPHDDVLPAVGHRLQDSVVRRLRMLPLVLHLRVCC